MRRSRVSDMARIASTQSLRIDTLDVMHGGTGSGVA